MRNVSRAITNLLNTVETQIDDAVDLATKTQTITATHAAVQSFRNHLLLYNEIYKATRD